MNYILNTSKLVFIESSSFSSVCYLIFSQILFAIARSNFSYCVNTSNIIYQLCNFICRPQFCDNVLNLEGADFLGCSKTFEPKIITYHYQFIRSTVVELAPLKKQTFKYL